MEKSQTSVPFGEETLLATQYGLGALPYAFIFFDNPPRGGDPEVVKEAELRVSTKTTHVRYQLVPLDPNPYGTASPLHKTDKVAPMPAFFHVDVINLNCECSWVIEVNKYRIAKCAGLLLDKFDVNAVVATLKTLQVAEALKKRFGQWLEEEYVKKGTRSEEAEAKVLLEAIDARIKWFHEEERKKNAPLLHSTKSPTSLTTSSKSPTSLTTTSSDDLMKVKETPALMISALEI